MGWGGLREMDKGGVRRKRRRRRRRRRWFRVCWRCGRGRMMDG